MVYGQVGLCCFVSFFTPACMLRFRASRFSRAAVSKYHKFIMRGERCLLLLRASSQISSQQPAARRPTAR